MRACSYPYPLFPSPDAVCKAAISLLAADTRLREPIDDNATRTMMMMLMPPTQQVIGGAAVTVPHGQGKGIFFPT